MRQMRMVHKKQGPIMNEHTLFTSRELDNQLDDIKSTLKAVCIAGRSEVTTTTSLSW